MPKPDNSADSTLPGDSECRLLTPLEFEELCDLFGKCGDGDLLDFIGFIQREASQHGGTQTLLDIMLHLPGRGDDE